MDPPKLPVNELARVCAGSGDAIEWQELLRRCAPLASLVAARVSRMWLGTVTPTTVDEIVQEVFLKLCEQERRILRDFKPRGEDSFLGLVRTVSASVANDYFRRQYSTKRGGKAVTIAFDDSPNSDIQPGSTSGSDMHKAVLFSELDRKMQAAPEIVSERDRAVFWFYYRQGLTAEEIAALPTIDLSAKGVESALRRITTWLRKELETRKRESPADPVNRTG
ncbi:MAG TPA: sigma-70 family RNA polymerase sigma factor [Terracidiphilus sp.]|nr:sigma-70 family RNA polymerase sigma factor [Terracidiphilus sp.]